jgi:aspartate aminotransferase
MEISTKIQNIKPSPTIAMNSKAKELKAQGKDIISLSAGEPDFNTFDNICEAAITAIKQEKTKYTAVDGTVELKDAIISKFKRDSNIKFGRENITVGSGGKQVIYNALVASINPGDEVIIPSPYWVSYPDMVKLVGGDPVLVDSHVENNFIVLASDLEKKITSKTKWIILNYPSNPTGSTIDANRLYDIAKLLKKHPQVNILSDDIYEHITYDGKKSLNILEVAPDCRDQVLIVNGASKVYSMTGWRIGYGAGPAELIKAMAKVQSQTTSNPCSISQEAATEALNGSQDPIEENNKLFKDRRDIIHEKINQIDGLSCLKPNGAFYLFISCEELIGRSTPDGKIIENDSDLILHLLDDALVAAVPGVAFGIKNYFRISYATSTEILLEACHRIKKSCDKLKK